MQKAYDRTYWQNYPSDVSPINETNLNKLSGAVDEIDNRVITLDTTKATKTEVSPLLSEVAFDEGTGVITFTRKNGAVVSIDTKLEKLAVNFAYDPETERLIITLDDGEKQYVDLSALITQYEFLDSDTIGLQVQADGSVKAVVLDGSITEDKLRPDYLADIKEEAAKAEASAVSANKSANDADYDAKLAQSYAVGGSGIREGEDEDNAKKYKELAAEAALTASEESVSAAASAGQAGKSAEEAALSEENSAESEINARGYAEDAETAALNAQNNADAATDKAIKASQSADIAEEKAEAASGYATEAESYAHGGTSTRENEDADNAMYYYEQTKRISQGFNGMIPMGNITFAELDDINNQKAGYMFNLSDSFTSDDRFKDGGGIFYGAGSNVVYTADGMWDVLAASMVSGVKGDSESEFRQGFVNITADNVGALAKDGDSADNIVSFTSGDSTNPTTWTDTAALVSGEKHSSLFNKLSTAVKNLRYIWRLIGKNDISTLGDGTITGAIMAAALMGGVTEVTQEEYDNLSEEEKSSNTLWAVSDGDGGNGDATAVNYDNTASGLDATNVQDAIDAVASDVDKANSNLLANSFKNAPATMSATDFADTLPINSIGYYVFYGYSYNDVVDLPIAGNAYGYIYRISTTYSLITIHYLYSTGLKTYTRIKINDWKDWTLV